MDRGENFGKLIQNRQVQFLPLPLWYAKNAENLRGSPNAELNVSLGQKARTRIEFSTFGKHRPHCRIKLAFGIRFLRGLHNLVKVIHYGAVQTPEDFIAIALVGRICILR